MRDSNFEWLLTEIEWIRVEKLMKLLDIFTNTSNLFSGTSHPTCNLCEAYASSNGFLKEMTQFMS
jgi:hypothetical protein